MKRYVRYDTVGFVGYVSNRRRTIRTLRKLSPSNANKRKFIEYTHCSITNYKREIMRVSYANLGLYRFGTRFQTVYVTVPSARTSPIRRIRGGDARGIRFIRLNA